MEIELNIDSNGRTTYEKAKLLTGEDEAESSVNLDYSCKTVQTSLAGSEICRKQLDELLYDCEVADCGLLPRTFWIDAFGTKPRCCLEQMALDVFHHHVPPGHIYDESKSGAEWWVQLRPSPAGGRYSMHDSDPDKISSNGISFHWDKDEELRLLMGGSMYVHPHISTVTYLTDLGAPTIAMNYRINTFTGEWIVPTDSDKDDSEVVGFLSWPKQGKHLSFDGRYLHAAPPDLMEPGLFERQCKTPETKADAKSGEKEKESADQRLLHRRHRRVTFLVNVWLNYKPMDVDLFPESMIDKLSKVDANNEPRLFQTEQKSQQALRVVVPSTEDAASSNRELPTRHFVWPLGGCGSNEQLHAQMPLDDIRKETDNGGNLLIQWDRKQDSSTGTKSGVQLVKEHPVNSPALEIEEKPGRKRMDVFGEKPSPKRRPLEGAD